MRYILTAAPSCFLILFIHNVSAQVKRDSAGTAVSGDTVTRKALAPAIVVGKKPIIQTEIDRLRWNVSQTGLGSGNTVWDLIGKAPLVSVSEDGTIRIAGTTGAMVYVNNRRKMLTGSALKAWLSALPSDNVEAIEVITTPSSKYDAEGGAGILNIVTKKNKQDGFDGNISVVDRQTALNSQSGNAFLNDRQGKWDVYSSMYLVNRRRKQLASQDFYFPAAVGGGSGGPTPSFSSVRSTTEYQVISSGVNLGVDYQLKPNQVAGLLFDYSGSRNNNTRDADSYSQYATADSLTSSHNKDKINSQTWSLNLNYDARLDSTGTRLSVDLDALRYTSSFNSVSQTDAVDGALERTQDYFRSSSPQEVSNWSAKADFKKPFSKRLSLEAGAKISFSTVDDNLVFENFDGAGGWIKDNSRSNLFRYDENIAAAYAILDHKISTRWAYQVGTRLENTIAKGWLNGQTAVDRNYVSAFPTGFLKFSPNAQRTYALAVSSRITRPGYWDVNPFRSYTTDKTWWEGNPFLLPSRYYREELRHSLNIKKAGYTFLLAAAQTIDEIYALPSRDTGDLVVFRKVNYGNKYSYTAALIYTSEVRPWWQLSATLQTGYIRSVGHYAAVSIDNKTFLLNLSTNQTFTIARKAGLSCTVIASNSLPSTVVNTHIGDRLDTEIRLRKTAGPFSFTVAGTDLFKTNKDNYLVHAGDLRAIEEFYNDTRSVAVTMNYNFGRSTVRKNRDRDVQFQGVKDRLM